MWFPQLVLIQSCINQFNLRHHVSLESFYDLTMCKTYQKLFFNVKNIIIIRLNTIIHIIITVDVLIFQH